MAKKIFRFLPFRSSRLSALLIGFVLGIASQRIPEVKSYTDQIMTQIEDHLDWHYLPLLLKGKKSRYISKASIF
ncbi:hypothetical protein [Candidatus Protochlamydia phocaeensis]|uniref:hypothetical protein n=1 Tax=Candidatus Protochlamydia phocaeensis TaxID=1414722 RepID=UPI00083929A3|nr:hypothetical protein [Candidatus Protochlamydia phocaeensis]